MSEWIDFRAFENRSDASSAAADLLAGLLRAGLAETPLAEASLVVSGGSTPGPCFDQLSAEELDWGRVTVLPSDERWVSAQDPDSNERLIRQRLLTGQAQKGSVLSFYREGKQAKQAPVMIERDLKVLGQTFSAVLLGMGEDGHFASLFPDFMGLNKALDPNGESRCIMVQTAGSPYLRISLTLSALLESKAIVLLIFGDSKRTVFDAALKGEGNFPVEALLKHTDCPLTVVWAP